MSQPAAAPIVTPKPLLFIKNAGKFMPIADENIYWIEAEGNYARLHTEDVQYTVRSSLAALLSKLPEDRFVRIHRSTLVNTSEIAFIEPWFSGEMLVVLNNGAKLRMSRSYRTAFRQRFPFLA